MKNIWRKMRDCWLDFWEDDELDMNKKHLSQHDKRSLLYGGFMIGVATFGLFSIGIIAGNIWTNHQNQKDMEEFLGTVVTYMATATDDEYEEIAQTIQHDLVYSQYGQDVRNLIRYIPNTTDGCIAFWTSRISSSAGVVSGALSLSFSCALRMSWRMVSHVLCVTWQKKSSSST